MRRFLLPALMLGSTAILIGVAVVLHEVDRALRAL